MTYMEWDMVECREHAGSMLQLSSKICGVTGAGKISDDTGAGKISDDTGADHGRHGRAEMWVQV